MQFTAFYKTQFLQYGEMRLFLYPKLDKGVLTMDLILKKAYQAPIKLNKNMSLLQAVTISFYNEGALYKEGSLIADWLGLDRDENVETLSMYGIEPELLPNERLIFKYKEPEKNKEHRYVVIQQFQLDGKEQLRCDLHIEAPKTANLYILSLHDLYVHCRLYYTSISVEHIHVYRMELANPIYSTMSEMLAEGWIEQ